MAKQNQPVKRDIYQEVTNKIIELLDQGTVPWRNPIKYQGASDGMPKSLTTGKHYRGINMFLLAMTAFAKGYESTYWLTFNQTKKLGGNIRKGEKASLVTFWKQLDKEEEETGKKYSIPILRHYNVFNVDQISEITPPDAEPTTEPTEPFIPIEQAEHIASGYPNPPEVIQGGSRAYYKPAIDTIYLPKAERFDPLEERYSTLFHELVHSTGHEQRLNRKIGSAPSAFGSQDYGEEELIAELGSAFLCAHAGISPATIEQSASYIDGWRKKLKQDKKLVVHAAAVGQRASDYILDLQLLR